MWLLLLANLFIGALQATYFSYENINLPADSIYEITIEELDKWIKNGEEAINDQGPTARWLRFQAYLKMAQNDFAELGEGKGSVGYLSYQILRLFVPGYEMSEWSKGMDDPFSKQLGDIVFQKYKKRFEDEVVRPQTFEIGGGWHGYQPYFGIDVGSLTPWYVKSQAFLCLSPPKNSAFWELQMAEVDLLSSKATSEEKKSVDFWAGPKGDLILIANAYMYDHNSPLLERTKIRAILASALSDSCSACFLSKYTYMIKRPFMFKEGYKPLIATPNHPSYPSAHSTNTSALVVLLDYYLPDPVWKKLATEAGLSRIIAGLHYPIDHVNGQELGTRIGTAILDAIKQSPSP